MKKNNICVILCVLILFSSPVVAELHIEIEESVEKKLPSLSIFPMPAFNYTVAENWIDAYDLAIDELNIEWCRMDITWRALEADMYGLMYFVDLVQAYDDVNFYIEISLPHVSVRGSVPDDVQNLTFNDPYLQNRFLEFIQTFAQIYNGSIQAVFIGNEIDEFFYNYPEEYGGWLSMYSQAVTIIYEEAPHMKVGTVLTYHNALKNNMTHLALDVGPISNILGVSYYPEMMPEGYEPNNIDEQFDHLVDTYGEYTLALVESGVAAHGPFGGSKFEQIRYCRKMLEALIRHNDTFIFGGWFNLHDFSPEIVDQYRQEFGDEFADWVGSIGLISFEGVKRPVFHYMKFYHRSVLFFEILSFKDIFS